MSIVVFGVQDNQCHTYLGFRKYFDTSKEADLFLQLQCAKINIKEIHRYAIYIGNEFTTLDAVMHLHNWKGTDSRFKEETNKIKVVDIKQIKLYYDLEYQRQQQKKSLRDAERLNEINNMDAAGIEYHRQLFKELDVKLF